MALELRHFYRPGRGLGCWPTGRCYEQGQAQGYAFAFILGKEGTRVDEVGSGSRDPPREFLLAPVRGPYSNRLLLRFEERERAEERLREQRRQAKVDVDR